MGDIKDVLGENDQISEVCQSTVELDVRNAQERSRRSRPSFVTLDDLTSLHLPGCNS
ncbi:hypothetical protein [Bradyrhizobium sp. BR 1432]|uniref:hypothetical protein n=1 Tax=Bradyrhizobium sp. BR 1432 TaxID=3447966 RepID=UPI003EE54F0D